MLRYERALHFDEHYRRLQKRKGLYSILSLLYCNMSYLLLYYLLRCLLNALPDVCSWQQTKMLWKCDSFTITWVDLVYLCQGLLMMCYSSVRLIKITEVNHSVRTGKTPDRLLTDGVYAKSRHPMYAIFVMMYGALFLSLHSLDGIIFTILMLAGQYLNAVMEERKLHILFQKDYVLYCKKTKQRVLSKVQIAYLLAVTGITLAGFGR